MSIWLIWQICFEDGIKVKKSYQIKPPLNCYPLENVESMWFELCINEFRRMRKYAKRQAFSTFGNCHWYIKVIRVSLALSPRSILEDVKSIWIKLCRTYRWNHRRRKVHERILVILAAQPGPNGQLSCLHSFKIFWHMKPKPSGTFCMKPSNLKWND